MQIRPLRPDDYAPLIAVLDAWWGGRPMAAMLPRLFFVHFHATSLAAEDDGQLRGFLVGFCSPTLPDEAYIHFVGVDPTQRGRQVGQALYTQFFALVRAAGRYTVRCVTAPHNSGSIAFHQRMGFHPEPAPTSYNGVPYHADYDGPGEDRVLFVKRLDTP